MIRHSHLYPFIGIDLLPHMFEAILHTQQGLGRYPAQGNDQLGLDDPQLLLQMRQALLHLGSQRIPVIRRPALENITDVDIPASQLDGRQDLVQQLPGPANERLPLTVLSVTSNRAISFAFRPSREKSIRLVDVIPFLP